MSVTLRVLSRLNWRFRLPLLGLLPLHFNPRQHSHTPQPHVFEEGPARPMSYTSDCPAAEFSFAFRATSLIEVLPSRPPFSYANTHTQPPHTHTATTNNACIYSCSPPTVPPGGTCGANEWVWGMTGPQDHPTQTYMYGGCCFNEAGEL